MAEFDNPIFYLNLIGFVAGIVLLVRTRYVDVAPGWKGLTWVMTVATGLHFLGDLFEVSEDADHIFIHAAVMVAFLVAVVWAPRE